MSSRLLSKESLPVISSLRLHVFNDFFFQFQNDYPKKLKVVIGSTNIDLGDLKKINMLKFEIPCAGDIILQEDGSIKVITGKGKKNLVIHHEQGVKDEYRENFNERKTAAEKAVAAVGGGAAKAVPAAARGLIGSL